VSGDIEKFVNWHLFKGGIRHSREEDDEKFDMNDII
jgi:hypothetical protein